MHVLTIGKKNWCTPHFGVSGRGVEVMRGSGWQGEPVGGLGGCAVGWQVGWLVL